MAQEPSAIIQAFFLPELPGGAATVLDWLAAPGEHVAAGAPLVLLLTARAELLLPAPAAGTLSAPAPSGTTIAPGELLASLVVAAPARAAAMLRATPLARSIARRHELELATLSGRGPQGQIRAGDVRQALNLPPTSAGSPPPPTAPAPLPEPGAYPDNQVIRFFSGRAMPSQTLPEKLSGQALSHPVHASVTVELDAGTTLARATHLGLSLTILLVEAVAALLPEHGLLNGAWHDSAYALLRRRQHIAVGELGPQGLRWALVRDAGDLNPRGLLRALATPGGDLSHASFAVVSLPSGAGWLGLQPPLPWTAAALSLAQPTLRPVVYDDKLIVRPIALLSLSYDARLLDHHHGVAFLRQLRARLA